MGVPNLSTSVVAYDSSVYSLCWEGGEPEYDGALAQWVTTNARKDHTKTLIFISSIKTRRLEDIVHPFEAWKYIQQHPFQFYHLL